MDTYHQILAQVLGRDDALCDVAAVPRGQTPLHLENKLKIGALECGRAGRDLVHPELIRRDDRSHPDRDGPMVVARREEHRGGRGHGPARGGHVDREIHDSSTYSARYFVFWILEWIWIGLSNVFSL